MMNTTIMEDDGDEVIDKAVEEESALSNLDGLVFMLKNLYQTSKDYFEPLNCKLAKDLDTDINNLLSNFVSSVQNTLIMNGKTKEATFFKNSLKDIE